MVSQAELQEQRIGAEFMRKAIRAGVAGDLNGTDDGGDDGGMEYGYDGDPRDLEGLENVRPFRGRPADDREPEDPSEYEETEADKPNYVIARFVGGETLELEIPPMTMEKIEMFSWHQNRVAQRHNELMKVGGGNPKGLQQAKQNSTNAKRNFIRYVIPTFPPERFGDLLASSFMELVNSIEKVRQEAVGETTADQPGEVYPNL